MALLASRAGAGVPESVRKRERLLVSAGVFRLDKADVDGMGAAGGAVDPS
jgi:hypothetical protein